MIENQQVFVQDVQQIGCIIAFLPAFTNGDILGVLYTIEGSVSEQSALLLIAACDLELIDEMV